jgi:hypothetical protein
LAKTFTLFFRSSQGFVATGNFPRFISEVIVRRTMKNELVNFVLSMHKAERLDIRWRLAGADGEAATETCFVRLGTAVQMARVLAKRSIA